MRWFHVEPSSSCPSYTPGLYTAEQIDTLVFVDGYIPVASAAEFDAIRTGVSETMGAGTCWAGSYTTGPDKKYIQILDIDLTSISVGFVTIPTHNFIYDGNRLRLHDYGSGPSLFRGTTIGTSVTIKNTIFDNIAINEPNSSGIIRSQIGDVTFSNNDVINSSFLGSYGIGNNGTGIAVGYLEGALIAENNLIQNTSRTFSGLLVGNCLNADSIIIDGLSIINCTSDDPISQRGSVINSEINIAVICRNVLIDGLNLPSGGNINKGLIAGYINGAPNCLFEKITIKDSSIADNALSRLTGALIGNISSTNITIKEIKIINTQIRSTGTAGTRSSGLVGVHVSGTVVFENIQIDELSVFKGGIQTGSIIGAKLGGSASLTNLYSASQLFASASVGGLVGTNAGTLTASQAYWDTDTSGVLVSAAGTGQTTVALQTPTSNTGIYSAWTIPPWQFGTDTEYPVLTTTP